MNQTYDDDILLMDLIKILIKRKKIIIVSVLVMSILGINYSFSISYQNKNKYEAISSISVIYNYKSTEKPEEITEGYVYYQDRLSDIIIPTIKSNAQSFTLLRSVINENNIVDAKGEFIKVTQLKSNVVIESQENGNLLLIKVKDKDEDIAVKIANAIQQKIIKMKETDQRFIDCNISVVDYAITLEKVKPNKFIPILIAALMGLIIGVLFAFIKNNFSKYIQSKNQTKRLGLDVEFDTKHPFDFITQNKIITIIKLSNIQNLLIAVDDKLVDEYRLVYADLFEKNKIDLNIASYKDNQFLLKTKEYELTLMCIQENITEIKFVEEIVRQTKKYNINLSSVFIEK